MIHRNDILGIKDIKKGCDKTKTLVIYYSKYYGNTEKVANAIADGLDAVLMPSQQVEVQTLLEYDLIGFGSGIYHSKHHRSLCELAEKSPLMHDKKAFLFSSNRDGTTDSHTVLREILHEKGFKIIGEFSCKGYQEWRAMKIVGATGINQGKPDAEDLQKAKTFAWGLKKKFPIDEEPWTLTM
jgi:flavodoxin